MKSIYVFMKKILTGLFFLVAVLYLIAMIYTNIFYSNEWAADRRRFSKNLNFRWFEGYSGFKTKKSDEAFNALLKFYKEKNAIASNFIELGNFEPAIKEIMGEDELYFINSNNYEIGLQNRDNYYRRNFGEEIIEIDLDRIVKAIKNYSDKNGAPPDQIEKLKDYGLAAIPVGPYGSAYTLNLTDRKVSCVFYYIEDNTRQDGRKSITKTRAF